MYETSILDNLQYSEMGFLLWLIVVALLIAMTFSNLWVHEAINTDCIRRQVNTPWLSNIVLFSVVEVILIIMLLSFYNKTKPQNTPYKLLIDKELVYDSDFVSHMEPILNTLKKTKVDILIYKKDDVEKVKEEIKNSTLNDRLEKFILLDEELTFSENLLSTLQQPEQIYHDKTLLLTKKNVDEVEHYFPTIKIDCETDCGVSVFNSIYKNSKLISFDGSLKLKIKQSKEQQVNTVNILNGKIQ